MFVERLKILVLLLLPKIARSYEFFSIGEEQFPFIIDIFKLSPSKSVIFLHHESIKEMEMTTMIFKWRRVLSREGIASTNLHFSQLHKSSYYVKQIVRPYYIAVIFNNNAINAFSLATTTFDMSSAMWLVIFIYKKHGFDYCHNPPGNIFHLKFDSEMLVRYGTENILREWYSVDTNLIEINDVAIWNLEKGITKMITNSLYDRRYNLQGLIMKAVIVKGLSFINVKKNGKLGVIFSELLNQICITLNVSFDIVSEVEEFGRWNPNKKTFITNITKLHVNRKCL